MQAIRATHAFDGVRFLDGGATVLIEGDRIAGVESWGHAVPHDCPVTAYDGTLLPGLIDCHTHLVSDASLGGLERAADLVINELDHVIERSLRAQAAAGVTTVRDLGDVDYRTLELRDRQAAGLPRIVAAGPPITVRKGHCHFLGGAVHGVDEVRRAVEDHAEAGVDVIKVMVSGGMLTPGSDVFGVQFTFEELTTLVATAHGLGLRVLAHTHSLAGAWHAVNGGVDGMEHVTCLAPEGVTTDEALFAAIAAAGITIDPTLGTDRAQLPPPELMPPTMRAMIERLGLDFDQLMERRVDQLRAARDHGVRLVTGVDSGAGPGKPHGAVWRAVLELLPAYPLAEALATATSLAADDCGLTDRTGRLSRGLAADLVVVDGDVTATPEALSRPVRVWVRGASPAGA